MNWAPLLRGGGAALKRGALIAGHLQDGAIRGDCRKLTYDSNFSNRLFWYVFLHVVSSKSWENHEDNFTVERQEEPSSKFCHSYSARISG